MFECEASSCEVTIEAIQRITLDMKADHARTIGSQMTSESCERGRFGIHSNIGDDIAGAHDRIQWLAIPDSGQIKNRQIRLQIGRTR